MDAPGRVVGIGIESSCTGEHGGEEGRVLCDMVHGAFVVVVVDDAVCVLVCALLGRHHHDHRRRLVQRCPQGCLVVQG